MKANQTVSYTMDQEEGVITFTVKGFPSLTLDMTKVHLDNVSRAAFIGMAQVRIVDAAAVARADQDGNLIDETTRTKMKHDRMAKLIAHYESGSAEWSVRQERAATDHTLTIRAIAQLRQITITAASELVDKWAKSLDKPRTVVLDSFAAREDVSAAIREYRAEATKHVDTEALMAELGE